MPVLEAPLTVEQLLTLPKEMRSTIVEVWTMVHATRYTGPVTFHCKDGRPLTVQVLPPNIKLTED